MRPTLLIGDNANELMYSIYEKLMNYNDPTVMEVSPRDGLITREITHCVSHLENINNCFIFMPKRKNDIIACIAECLWVVAGRGDMKFLSKFLPRAINYSDDKEIWRANYGFRLRKARTSNNEPPLDQIDLIIKHLKYNPNSRQAVMTIWDPALDLTEKTIYRDYPCSNWLHFLLRDNKLECTLTIRSNDALFGLSQINIAEFCFIQKIIASILKVAPGSLTILSDSLHVYSDKYDQINEIINNKISFDYSYFKNNNFEIESLELLDNVLTEWFELVDNFDNLSYQGVFNKLFDLSYEIPGFYDYLVIPIIGLYLKKDNLDCVFGLMDFMCDSCILKRAIDYQIYRKITKLDNEYFGIYEYPDEYYYKEINNA